MEALLAVLQPWLPPTPLPQPAVWEALAVSGSPRRVDPIGEPIECAEAVDAATLARLRDPARAGHRAPARGEPASPALPLTDLAAC
jgi:hypothetical protein